MRGSDDLQPLVAGLHLVAGVQLPAAAGLGLAVHEHRGLGEVCLGLAARVDDAGQLEELPEPDHLAADAHISHAEQRILGRVRYWLPLVAALICLIVSTMVSAIPGFVLIILAFFFVIEVSTKFLQQAGGTGRLKDHRQ